MSTAEFSPAPFDMETVLSADWLTYALQASCPGAIVREATVVEMLESTATKVRFTVDYEDTGGQSAPTALCVKGYLNPAHARFGVTGVHEVRFYDRLAGTVPIRTPRARYTGIDPDTQHGLVLMDDVVAGGAVFFNQLDSYDVATARSSLTELARLHATFWEDPLQDEDWLAPKIRTFPDYIPTEVMDELLQGPRAAGFPAEVRDAARLKEGMLAVADRYSGRSRTLIHADAHLGNLYRTDDGRIGFVDWQNYEFSHWSQDVAYHLATALDPATRSSHERQLVEFYLGQLEQHGGPAMAVEDVWDDYRASLTYGYFLWAMTRRVVDHVTVELTQRVGSAVIEHGSLEVLGV